MLRKMRHMGLGAKISSISFVLVAVVFGTFVWAVSYSTSALLEKRALEDLAAKNKSVVTMIDIFNADLAREANRSLNVFAGNFSGKFTVDPSSQIIVAGKPTPLMKNGDVTLNNNFSVPDKFTSNNGITATVFARTGDDFIRITTSLKTDKGKRAIGTTLTRTHPAFKLLHSGKSYGGIATLFGRKYYTKYSPIKGAGGKIIGVLFIGIDFTEDVKAIKSRIGALKVGDTGYFYVLEAKPGKNYGNLAVHPMREGENVLDERSSDGQAFIQKILDKKQGVIHYMADVADGAGARDRIAAFDYFSDWNWIVVGDTFSDELTRELVKMRNLFVAGGALAVILLSLFLYALIRKSMVAPLIEATVFAKQIAQGDLTARMETRRADEVGQLLMAMNNVSQGLANVVWNVRRSAETLESASHEIASGNQDLSSRTEQQASSLEETASSMEELTSTVRMNAENGIQANNLASEASNVAAKGGEVVSQVVETMGAINESSKKISDIISVIDGIAFQTNILALNAAVEAARAGEQGRGFAVVATEVRSLAQRSAGAAREIKGLIDNSVEKVAVGSALVEQAGATMTEVVASIRRVNDIMGEITAASKEQSEGIEQVNQAIAQMDQVTQQNAALVEQVAASSETMEGQTEDLVKRVGIFKLKSAGTGTAEEAVELVKKAISSFKTNGVQSTFSEISDPLGQYVDRDLYVAVYDENGRNVAHGANAKLIGQDLMSATDGGGKLYVRERIDLVRNQVSAWQNYQFMNPVSSQIEPKSMYLEKYSNFIVGCGIYEV